MSSALTEDAGRLRRLLGGSSNVRAYESGPDWIVVQFADGSEYTSTTRRAGSDNIARLKELARYGRELKPIVKNTQAMTQVAYKADLQRLPKDASSLNRWMKRAKEVLLPLVHDRENAVLPHRTET